MKPIPEHVSIVSQYMSELGQRSAKARKKKLGAKGFTAAMKHLSDRAKNSRVGIDLSGKGS